MRSLRRALEANEARLRELKEELEKKTKEDELREAQMKLKWENLEGTAKSWHLRVHKKVVWPVKRLVATKKKAHDEALMMGEVMVTSQGEWHFKYEEISMGILEQDDIVINEEDVFVYPNVLYAGLLSVYKDDNV